MSPPIKTAVILLKVSWSSLRKFMSILVFLCSVFIWINLVSTVSPTFMLAITQIVYHNCIPRLNYLAKKRVELVGERENGRARGRHARETREGCLACLLFDAPTTSKRLLRRLALIYQNSSSNLLFKTFLAPIFSPFGTDFIYHRSENEIITSGKLNSQLYGILLIKQITS